MKSPSLSTLLLTLAAIAAPLHAQIDPSADTQATKPATLAPDDEQEASVVEDGGDLSALTTKPRALKIRVYAVNDFEYQSNADLDGNAGEGSLVWFPSLAANANLKLCSAVSLDTTVAAVAGVYSDVNNQDFWGLDGKVFLKYRPRAALPALLVGTELYDYESLEDGSRLSRGVAPTVGLEYDRYLAGSRTYLFANARYQHHYASPSLFDRDVAQASVGATQQLCGDFYAQGFYEYRFTDYGSDFSFFGRKDERHTVGASLIYSPTADLRLRLNLTFTDNDSDFPFGIYDYQSFNAGVGSALLWQF